MNWVNVLSWSKVMILAGALSIPVNLTASTERGSSKEQQKKPTPATQIGSPKGELQAAASESDDDYVVVLTEKDKSPLQVYQKYLNSADFWRQLADYNLLENGVAIRVPKDMLKTGQIPAKISKFSGRVEIARNFDWNWVKVVPGMLVQEGDWIRTRARSSAEVLQDDGTVIHLRPDTKIMFSSAGESKTARGAVRTTKVKMESGSIFAKVQKLMQRDSRFEIQTPTATSFIRGTEFRVKLEEAGATRLEVLEGAVDFGSETDQVSVQGNFGSLVDMAGATPDQPHSLPAAPGALLTPEDRQVLDGDIAGYRFSWEAVANAARYHVEVATDSEFKQLVEEAWVDGADADMMSLRLDALEPGTYFWRVSALDAQGYESPWSRSRHFVYPLKLQ